MNCEAGEKIARAVMYEGYILYPYRPSAMKNRQRFNFGVLYPRQYCEVQSSEAWCVQTECLVVGGPECGGEAKTPFLHLMQRPEWAEGYEREAMLPLSPVGSVAANPLLRRF